MTADQIIAMLNSMDSEETSAWIEKILTECLRGRVDTSEITRHLEETLFRSAYSWSLYSARMEPEATLDEFVRKYSFESLIKELDRLEQQGENQ